MDRSKRISPLLACLALGASLAACGEKEEPATTGALVTTQSTTGSTTTTTPYKTILQPMAVANLFLTGKPAGSIDICSEGMTPQFLRKSYGGRPGCLASRRPNALATASMLGNASARAGRWAIPARPKGGTYDGDKLTITVVKTDGAWKIDGLRSNAPVGP